MYRFAHPRRYFNGLLFLLIQKAFGRRNGRQLMTRPQKISPLKVLIAALVLIMVVLPAICMIGGWVAQARWKAAHPVQTIVPDVSGFDRATAEAAIKNAQLRSEVFSTSITDKCWEVQPQPNTIVDQTPDAGTPVPVGTLTKLYLGVNRAQ